ncbi:hypothetical protein [Phormidesmis priestleyi]
MSDPYQRSLPRLPLSIQSDPRLIITPIYLVASLPEPLAVPKFEIGPVVLWSKVPSHDFGRIIGLVYAHSVSVTARGYHYAIAFDEDSPSQADCAADWAFEDDLELVSTHAPLFHS